MKIFENPAIKIVAGFLSFIFLGAFFLSLPFMRNGNVQYSFIDILFTVGSSICVTGLSTLDISQYFSIYGQIFIMFLIQIGGLGYMTMAVMLLAIIKKKLTIVEKLATQSSLGKFTMQGLVEFVLYVIKITLIIEFIGAILLTIAWYPKLGNKAIFYGLFHSVSAFCNAGFSLFSDNLASYYDNYLMIIVISSLIVIGGIGFVVINDLIKYYKVKKLSYHSKLVLLLTVFFIFVPAIIFFITEFNNPLTIGNYGFLSKILVSIFNSITPRTAGFNITNWNQSLNINIFICIILMFIGASPAGTGGGIKTTTVAIIWNSFTSMFKGTNNVNILHRKIELKTVEKSWVLFFASVLICIFFVGLLLLVEKFSFLEILFEAISAFGTVGLSLGITAKLTIYGKFFLIILMFIGRIGSLLIVSGLFINYKNLNYQYAEEKILIG
jgi:trk system potassium uptake protein TrkH